jgi:hypothetical protein
MIFVLIASHSHATPTAAVGHRDVVTAVLTASAALAGLSLVFIAFLVAQGQNIADKRRAIPGWLTRMCVLLAIDTLIGLGCVGAALWWLVHLGTLAWPYGTTIVLFVLQLSLLALATILLPFRIGQPS